MTHTITETKDGILSICTRTETGSKTTRYIDSSRGLILDTMEVTPDARIFTKYKSDGIHIDEVEISTLNAKTIYFEDKKTPKVNQEILPDKTKKTVHYRRDTSINKVTVEMPEGTFQTTYFNADGKKPVKFIETNTEGLSKTTIFNDVNGQIQNIQEDLADGSILKTFFRADGTIEKKWQMHLKGLKSNTIRQTLFDKSGKKIIKTEDIEG